MSLGARLYLLGRNARRQLVRIAREKRANVAIMFGLMAPVLLGGLGIAMETGNWYYTQRGMQNAADAAAIAASTNGTSSYATEADAVAAQYGYTNGTNSVVVAASNSAACPAGGSTCYSVTITKPVPLYLAPVIGYSGNTTVNGKSAVKLQASATATQGTQSVDLCLLALGTTSTPLQTNGAPKANLAGCNVMSNGGADCNGHNLGATDGLAHGTDNGCGITQYSDVPEVSDPYAYLAASIPKNTCSSYAQESGGKKGGISSLPAKQQWSGTQTLGATTEICGDLGLTGDVTIDDSAGPAVLVIENGQLDTGSYTLSTASGSPVTIIFSGDGTYTGAQSPGGSGTLNIQAPTSGTWAGMAIYQDPNLSDSKGQMDISAAGNSPTWDITGVVYLPNASVTFSGAVGKSNNANACFVMVVNNITINGTADMLSNTQCAGTGVNQPQGQIPGRGQLVL